MPAHPTRVEGVFAGMLFKQHNFAVRRDDGPDYAGTLRLHSKTRAGRALAGPRFVILWQEMRRIVLASISELREHGRWWRCRSAHDFKSDNDYAKLSNVAGAHAVTGPN